MKAVRDSWTDPKLNKSTRYTLVLSTRAGRALRIRFKSIGSSAFDEVAKTKWLRNSVTSSTSLAVSSLYASFSSLHASSTSSSRYYCTKSIFFPVLSSFPSAFSNFSSYFNLNYSLNSFFMWIYSGVSSKLYIRKRVLLIISIMNFSPKMSMIDYSDVRGTFLFCSSSPPLLGLNRFQARRIISNSRA